MYVGGHKAQHAITEFSENSAEGTFCSPDLPSDKGIALLDQKLLLTCQQIHIPYLLHK